MTPETQKEVLKALERAANYIRSEALHRNGSVFLLSQELDRVIRKAKGEK